MLRFKQLGLLIGKKAHGYFVVLKQGLHFYVRDVRKMKEQEEAAFQSAEEKLCPPEECDEILDSGGARTTKQRLPLLAKLRLRVRK